MAVAAVPIALGVAALAGTALTAVGQVQQAQSASDAAQANAAIAEQQADVARETAAQEVDRAAVEAEIFAREARRRQGQRLSAVAASGITLSGSALDVLTDAALSDEQQRLLILHEGDERARARMAGASIEEMSAAEFQRQAAAERQAGRLAATGTIIGGVAQTGFFASQSPSIRRAFAGGSRARPSPIPPPGSFNSRTGMFGRV